MFDRSDTGHTQIPVSPNKPQSVEGAGDIFSYFFWEFTSLCQHRVCQYLDTDVCSRLPLLRAVVSYSSVSPAPDPANSHSTLEMRRRRPRQKNYESTAAGWLQCSALGPPVQAALVSTWAGAALRYLLSFVP